MIALTTSRRLCGGMFVAMPTAMPDEPLTTRFGMPAGSTVGSSSAIVEVRDEVDGVLVDVRQHLHRDRHQPRLRCSGTPPRGSPSTEPKFPWPSISG